MRLTGKIYIDRAEQQFVQVVETHAHIKHTLPMDYIHPRSLSTDRFQCLYALENQLWPVCEIQKYKTTRPQKQRRFEMYDTGLRRWTYWHTEYVWYSITDGIGCLRILLLGRVNNRTWRSIVLKSCW